MGEARTMERSEAETGVGRGRTTSCRPAASDSPQIYAGGANPVPGPRSGQSESSWGTADWAPVT
ncbi:hypothetical protein SALBM311S_03511 [Streptomyces alboniger]